MAKHCNYKCENCNISTTLKTGVIHHTKYTGNDYDKQLSRLLETSAIQWLCKECHKRAHTAVKPEETDIKIKNSGNCIHCLDFTWNAWFTIRDWQIPICSSCFKQLLDQGIIIQVEEEWKLELEEESEVEEEDEWLKELIQKSRIVLKYRFSDPSVLKGRSRTIAVLLNGRLATGVYGNVKTSNSKNINLKPSQDQQLGFFD